MSRYYYNYAVVDPAYPGEPRYWALKAISLGDAAKIGWTSKFVPEADATTALLLANLLRHQNKITLALTPKEHIPSLEPKWANGTTYDQLLIEVASDASYGAKRKLAFYHIRALSVKQTDEREVGLARVVLCQVARGAYVLGLG